MDLFRRNNKVQSFVTLKDDVILKYLGYNTVGIATTSLSLIKEIPGGSKAITDYICCINKATLSP
jgi:hypothetical protein